MPGTCALPVMRQQGHFVRDRAREAIDRPLGRVVWCGLWAAQPGFCYHRVDRAHWLRNGARPRATIEPVDVPPR